MKARMWILIADNIGLGAYVVRNIVLFYHLLILDYFIF